MAEVLESRPTTRRSARRSLAPTAAEELTAELPVVPPTDTSPPAVVSALAEMGPSAIPGAVAKARIKLLAPLRSVPFGPTMLGVALVLVGAVLLFIGWNRVSRLTDLSLQIPYLISCACSGLAVTAIGLTVINVSAKRSDSAQRRRQMTEMRELLVEIRQTVEDAE